MTKLNCVNLENILEEFGQLEEKITDISGKNSLLEIMLEDAKRLNKFYETKEKSLTEEKDSLRLTVNQLQLTLQEHCDLRVENEKLKNDVVNLKEQKERTAEVTAAEVQQLLAEIRAEEERHRRELDAVRQQGSRDVEDVHREALQQLEAKDAELKTLLEEKHLELEVMKRRLKDQERERQSELLKLQMEFGAKLARVESSAQRSQQQQLHGSGLLPQSVFKRKLQFFQEEKNKEISVLRQRIKELEENRRTAAADNPPKRRKV